MGRFLRIINGIARMADEGTLVPIFEQELSIGTLITSGTAVTVPASTTYTDLDLEVFLGGQRLDPGSDFSYLGSPPRTQVSFPFDLVVGDILIFRKARNA